MIAQTTWPVMMGLGTGAACAAALAAAVLATPVGGLIAQIVHVTDPVAYLASLGVIGGVPAGGVDSRRPRRQDRSDGHAATGLSRVTRRAPRRSIACRRCSWE